MTAVDRIFFGGTLKFWLYFTNCPFKPKLQRNCRGGENCPHISHFVRKEVENNQLNLKVPSVIELNHIRDSSVRLHFPHLWPTALLPLSYVNSVQHEHNLIISLPEGNMITQTGCCRHMNCQSVAWPVQFVV